MLWASTRGQRIAIGEIWRDPERQQRLVDAGVSWTLASDHLEGRAVDLQIYDAEWEPVDNPSAYAALGRVWVELDPDFNYWGFDEWGRDAYHFGRSRERRRAPQRREHEDGIQA